MHLRLRGLGTKIHIDFPGGCFDNATGYSVEQNMMLWRVTTASRMRTPTHEVEGSETLGTGRRGGSG